MKYLVVGIEDIYYEYDRARAMVRSPKIRTELFHCKVDAEVASRQWGNNTVYEVSAKYELIHKPEWKTTCL